MMMFRIVVLVALASATAASDKQTLRGGGSKDGGSNGGSTEAVATATLKNQLTCTTDGLNDQDLCQSATDDFNQSCVWCSSTSGFGLCVSSDQSSLIAQLMPDVDCGGGSIEEKTQPLEDLYDPACVLAGIQGGDDGESVCGDSQDADGGDCSWCSAAGGFGICLNEEQTALAKQFGGAYLTCADGDGDDTTIKGATRFYSWDASSENSSNSSPIPPDIPECFSHSKEDVCNDASDPSCVWCETTVGFGLCFSEEMAALARKMYSPFFDCGDAATAAALVLEEAETFMEEEAIETTVDEMVLIDDTAPIEDPLDPSCILAIANAEQSEAEGICKNTTDTDGDGCDWCTLADVYGVCLTPEQADMAAQYLTCDSGRSSSSAIVVQEEELAADFEEEVMIETKAMIKNPYDPACAVAAWEAADAESVCGDSADTEGDACIWCEAPTNNAGVCLNHEQAEIASQWLSCNLLGTLLAGAADDEVVAAQG